MREQLSLLFVDDDPLFLDLISLTAKEAFPGVKIVALPDAVRVQKICAGQRVDCAIFDYRMPELDGLECAKMMRASHPYLPIVLLTGAGDEVIAAAAFQNGVTDYIPKSRLNTQALRRTIKRAIELTTQKRTIDEQRTELETFAFALAHDFRQPLRQMMTFTSMIADELEGQGTPRLHKHLGFVEAAALRLTNLVDVMSEYTLLNKQVALEPVSIGDVVSDIKASIAPFIEERHGKVLVECDETVIANPVMLTQVMQNLIVNGLKYNDNPTPTVKITARRDRSACHISVRDNGIGIDSRHHEAIFSPLIRLHSQAEYTGTGLGLAIVRKAVTAQKGRVSCISEVGQGSEFILKLKAPTLPAQLPTNGLARRRTKAAEQQAQSQNAA